MTFVYALLAAPIGAAAGCAVWFVFAQWEEARARRYFAGGVENRLSRLLRRSADRWRRFKEFPDFLELLALGLSSGFTLARAWEEALRFLSSGPLKAELLQTANDFSLGRPRADAIAALTARLDDERLSGALALLTHSLKHGTPLEGILLDQSRRLRASALMALERRAQTASLRLLFPLVFFILPTIFIILFGPLALGFMETGRLF